MLHADSMLLLTKVRVGAVVKAVSTDMILVEVILGEVAEGSLLHVGEEALIGHKCIGLLLSSQ